MFVVVIDARMHLKNVVALGARLRKRLSIICRCLLMDGSVKLSGESSTGSGSGILTQSWLFHGLLSAGMCVSERKRLRAEQETIEVERTS